MESKHPVSLLGELSAKRKWDLPLYEVVEGDGSFPNRQFMYKVIVISNVFFFFFFAYL